mgnify:CR=1 FL=1
MKYLGGKQKIGKQISEIINKYYLDYDKPINGYIEPFCGALGVTEYLVEKIDLKITASDINPSLILLWNGLKNDTFTIPKKLSKKKWLKLKNQKEESALKAFAGFGCSFGGVYFSGYADDYFKKRNLRTDIKKRNSALETSKRLNKIKNKINNITFKCTSYDSYRPKNKIIYCDPPYRNTKQTVYSKYKFDSDKFWNIMRKWSKDNLVIISEQSAPRDFKCIWTKEVKRMGDKYGKDKKTNTDKLYILK